MQINYEDYGNGLDLIVAWLYCLGKKSMLDKVSLFLARQFRRQLECELMPSVMVAQLNIGVKVP